MPEPFDNLALDVLASLIAIVIAGVLGWLWRRGRGQPAAAPPDRPRDSHSLTVRAAGRTVTLQNVRVGGDLNIYVDRLPEAKPEVRDYFQEGRRLQNAERHETAICEFEKAFAAAEGDSQRCGLHVLMGNSFLMLGQLPQARSQYGRALAAAQSANDEPGAAAALTRLGLVSTADGELDNAQRYHEKALAIYQRLGDMVRQAESLAGLGAISALRGDLVSAEDYLSRSLAIHRQAGDKPGQATDLAALGLVHAARGRLADAEDYLRRSLAIHRNEAFRSGQAATLAALGNLYAQRGELDRAEAQHQEALAIHRQTGDKLGEANTLLYLGVLALRRNDPRNARDLLSQAKALYESIGVRGEALETVGAALERLAAAAAPPEPKRKTFRRPRPDKEL